jgi:hypothetical protein
MTVVIHPLEFATKIAGILIILGIIIVLWIIRNKKKKGLPIALSLRMTQSLLLALLCLIVFTALTFFIGYKLDRIDPGSAITYSLFGLLSATACFFIIRQNPRSVWFVPVIINAVFIFSAFVENFWGKPPDGKGIPMGYPVVGGWILTIITSIFGYLTGKRKIKADKSNPT